MSEGEGLITFGCLLIAAWAQILLWYRVGALSGLRQAGAGRVAFSFAPLAVAVAVLAALRAWASFDVRGAPEYLTMYTAAGVAWVFGAMQLWHHLRLSWRDDVLERGNPAALVAMTGVVAGTTAAYVGGNVGDGPGWWVVLYASGTATLALIAVVELLHRATDVLEKVVLDIDVGAGIRVAGFALAAGVIAGRGAAGDWYSFERMLFEFAAAWPLLPLLVAALLVERAIGRAAYGRGRIVISVLVAAAYLGAAAAALDAAPPLTENPRYGASR